MGALDRLKTAGNLSDFVGEANPEFDNLASAQEKLAVETAEKNSGMVEKPASFERSASPAERRQRLQQTLDQEKKISDEEIRTLDGQIRARYKIQVTFTQARKSHGNVEVGIEFWESGLKLHGGGDQKMMICKSKRIPDPKDPKGGCGNLIPADDIIQAPNIDKAGNPIGGLAICRHCKTNWVISEMTDWYYMRAPYKTVAERLVEFFRKLNGNADIFLKFHPEDFRVVEVSKALGHSKSRKAIYPLKNIIKDTSAGADITRRFHAFLTA